MHVTISISLYFSWLSTGGQLDFAAWAQILSISWKTTASFFTNGYWKEHADSHLVSTYIRESPEPAQPAVNRWRHVSASWLIFGVIQRPPLPRSSELQPTQVQTLLNSIYTATVLPSFAQLIADVGSFSSLTLSYFYQPASRHCTIEHSQAVLWLACPITASARASRGIISAL